MRSSSPRRSGRELCATVPEVLLVEPRSHKQVGLALEEIHQDLVRIEFPDGETRGS